MRAKPVAGFLQSSALVNDMNFKKVRVREMNPFLRNCRFLICWYLRHFVSDQNRGLECHNNNSWMYQCNSLSV